MKTLTIATRASKLALWQAEHVAGRIRAAAPGCEVRLLTVKTKGDVILDAPLAKIGGKGLFVREIEEALLDGRADLAVHSMKDLPADLPQGLILGAITEREDPRDLFLSARYANLADLPPAAVVGTSSLRRQAQVLALRPDLQISPLRGNVDTRLSKLMNGQYDAIVLAAAGVARLGLQAPHMRPFSPEELLPAAGQGALGIEFSFARQDVAGILARLDHAPTRLCVEAERAVLQGIGGSCQIPAAAFARHEGGVLRLDALIAQPDGKRIIRKTAITPASHLADAVKLGADTAVSLKETGGTAILQSLGLC